MREQVTSTAENPHAGKWTALLKYLDASREERAAMRRSEYLALSAPERVVVRVLRDWRAFFNGLRKRLRTIWDLSCP